MLRNFAAVTLLLAGCAGPLAALELTNGFVRGLPPTQTTTAAFFTARNPGNEAWVLTSVHSPAAARVEIHEHINRGGTMQMRLVNALPIAAADEVVFEPGGLHLMLMGLKAPLREGDSVSLRFESEQGETVEAVFPVISVVNEHRHHQHHN